jgi:transposase
MALSLPDSRQLSDEALRTLRLRALRGIELGFRECDLAELLGVSPSTVCRWWTAYQQGGLDAVPGDRTGRPQGSGGLLDAEQAACLQQIIDEHRPEEVGIAVPLWTRRAVCDLVRQEYGIRMKARTAGNYLQRWGYTAKRPILQDIKRDDSAIMKWVKMKFPLALQEAVKRSAYVVFIDESGFMMEPTVRRAYTRRGRRLVHRVADKHGRISAIGAIMVSPLQDCIKLQYRLLADNVNFQGSTAAQFLRTLRTDLAAPMTVFWDQIPIHSCSEVDEYLETEPDVVIEPFPPYAPEINPADGIWRYTKYSRLANYCPPDLFVLRRRITGELNRLQGLPELLKSFIRFTKLPINLK